MKHLRRSVFYLCSTFFSLCCLQEANAASLHVTGSARTSLSDFVAISTACQVNQPSTGDPPCVDDQLVSASGVLRSGAKTSFIAAAIDLPTGQIKVFSSAGSGAQILASASAVLDETVVMTLVPGAAPTPVKIRMIVSGSFSKNYLLGANGTNYNGRFHGAAGGVSTNPATIAMGSTTAMPIVLESEVMIAGSETFQVHASVSLNAATQRPVTLDFSTKTLDGLRFEVDLPPEVVMTSTSGVFLTERPQDAPPILPPPPPPGPPRWTMPVPGVGVPSARGFDPPIVRGYEYEAIGGTFMSVELPSDVGDGSYEIDVFDGAGPGFVFLRSLLGGEKLLFDLDSVARFRVRGIEADAGIDPQDLQAFVTQLSFTGPVTDMVMTPMMLACANGVDDDGDLRVDLDGSDPGCANLDDDDELGDSACDNGIDDDSDGLVDFPDDADCVDPSTASEVPEPGSAEMLAVGLALLGGLAERERRKTASNQPD